MASFFFYSYFWLKCGDRRFSEFICIFLKEKKEDEARKRQQRLADAETENQNSARDIEANQLNMIMSENGFVINEVGIVQLEWKFVEYRVMKLYF